MARAKGCPPRSKAFGHRGAIGTRRAGALGGLRGWRVGEGEEEGETGRERSKSEGGCGGERPDARRRRRFFWGRISCGLVEEVTWTKKQIAKEFASKKLCHFFLRPFDTD